MLSKKEVYESFIERRNTTEAGLSLQYDEAELNHQFYSGDEMAYRASVMDRGARKVVVFNRIKPFINAITGFMMKLRRQADYQAKLPNKEIQEELSREINAFASYLRTNASMDQVESKQDKENLICGYAAIDTDLSYLMNPAGEVTSESLRYNEVGWDPLARATNLTDARWVYRKKIISRDDALDLYGGDAEDFEGADTTNKETVISDVYRRVGVNDIDQDLVQVFNYQWWEYQSYYKVKNPLVDGTIQDPEQMQSVLFALQQISDMVNDDEDNYEDLEDLFSFDLESYNLIISQKSFTFLKKLMGQYGVKLSFSKHKRRCLYTALISGDRVIKVFKSKNQEIFTIQFKTGDYDEYNNLWSGLVTQLREPSRYANKALTEILYVIAANSKGGVMYEESAVENTSRFEAQYASTTSAIRVADGALSGGKIQPKASSALPTGYENVLAQSKNALFEVSGVNPEFMGSSENKQVSALLESQRIEQVVSTLAQYFDSATLYQKMVAKLLLDFMKVINENDPSVIVRIADSEGETAYSQINNKALLAEYDIEVREMPQTQVQKIQNLQLLTGVADKLLMVGQNIYPAIIDELPLTRVQKNKIMQVMQPEMTPEQKQQQTQQAQQAQMMAQLQLQKTQLDMSKQQVDIVKTQAETDKLGFDTEKTQVETQKTTAEIAKTFEETEKLDLENDKLAVSNVTDINFSI